MQCSSVDLPEPDGPMIAVSRAVSNSTVDAVERAHLGFALAVDLLARPRARRWWSGVDGRRSPGGSFGRGHGRTAQARASTSSVSGLPGHAVATGCAVPSHTNQTAGRRTKITSDTQRVDPQGPRSSRGVDAQVLEEEPGERVQHDVERERLALVQTRPLPQPDRHAAFREQQERRRWRGTRATRRGTWGGTSRPARSPRPVLDGDLEPPRQRRRPAEQLLVEPVAPTPDRLREHDARRRGSRPRPACRVRGAS